MRFSHFCIVARDGDRLAGFYKQVFGCEEIRPGKLISGENVSRGIGVSDAKIYSIWLSLPEMAGPFLEIHEYAGTGNRETLCAKGPDYRHMSFIVEDIHSTSAEIVAAGGTKLGEITNLGTTDRPFLAVYMRDLEGNVIELEEMQGQLN